MIIVTGAAGFIGSCFTAKLNAMGIVDLALVDDFTQEAKRSNWENRKYVDKIDRTDFFRWAESNAKKIDFIVHLGARTDTTEFDYALLEELNLVYSQRVWSFSVKHSIPLIYASSAATYGDGKFGYKDDPSLIHRLAPLNLYGKSKNEFDKWVLKQSSTPPFWTGFKFFNVFGPNEYHKKRMASVVFHGFKQIQESGKMNLFRSHNSNFKDGEQMRDFIYVKDVVNVLYWFMNHTPKSGIFNLGTGYARPFIALTNAIFKAMKKESHIDFIDIPEDIRDKYQYFTQAELKNLRKCGYKKHFRSLELAVKDYITQYLLKKKGW